MACILVCDDSILARKQLKDAVVEIIPDVEFMEARNGQEAVDLFLERQPDLAFFDIVMPMKDGVQAVSEICAKYPKAQIIMVSSLGTQQQLKNAIAAGAKDFLQKPFDKAQIKSILEKRFMGE